VGTFSVPTAVYGVAFDGTNIWVTGSPYYVELRASDGKMIGPLYNDDTAGVAFDGANIWVANTFLNRVDKK
jgi:hypothetical protein